MIGKVLLWAPNMGSTPEAFGHERNEMNDQLNATPALSQQRGANCKVLAAPDEVKSLNTPSASAGWKVTVALMLAFVGVTPCRADSIIDVVPPGLSPGDQYRLVFLTSGGINGTSSDIGTYNAFVNTFVDSTPSLEALGATWGAIATTVNEAIYDTIDRAAGVPIYNLAGQEVAEDATQGAGGLFSGSIMNPIDVTDTGETVTDGIVWTGSTAYGGNNPSDALGTTAYGGAEIYVGYAGPTYLEGDWLSAYLYGSSAELSMYAISSVLTVPASAPEPSTIGFSLIGLSLLCATVRRRRARGGR
jgi:hypothetical protein